MSSCWFRLKVRASILLEEILTYQLRELGSEGIEIRSSDNDNVIIISYHRNPIIKNRVESKLRESASIAFPDSTWDITAEVLEYKAKDWLKIQADAFGITHVSKKITILPPREKEELDTSDDEKIYIIINPGSAFGTGEHPTTRQCLIGLERYIHKNDTVLDIGAGSGILSIAAVKFGAKEVFAVEIDEDAVKNGMENIRLNECENSIQWHHGSMKTFRSLRKFDLILANIFTYVIMREAVEIRRFASQSSKFIFSGITKESAPNFIKAITKRGYDLVDTLPEGEWQTYVMELR